MSENQSSKTKGKGGKGGRGRDKKPRKNSPLRPDLAENTQTTRKRGRPPGPPIGGNAEQKRATALEMFAKGKTVAQVARHIGCAERTIYDYLREDDFKAKLTAIHAAAKANAERVLLTSAEKVARSLVRTALEGGTERASSVSAGKLILDIIGIRGSQRIEVQHSGAVGTLSDEELVKELEKMRGAE